MASLSNTTVLGQALGPLIAQPVICAYPISDIFAPTPRYLYYALLALIFLLPRLIWITRVFLGAAVAYAATAAIGSFMLISHQAPLPGSENITIPFITNASDNLPADTLLDVSAVSIQPNTLDLDLDAITAIVVTAYLIGLPLQTWSTTVNSSRMIRYMVLVWNAVLFAAAICALVTWPSTNTGPEQYRFCYARFPDDESVISDGWDAHLWQGSWNSTVEYIFGNPGTVWQALPANCFYPCFNTSQVLRQSHSLRATVLNSGNKVAKLHDPDHFDDDAFTPLIYTLVLVFTAAQIVLYLSPLLRLCSSAIPVYEPSHLWSRRRALWNHFESCGKANGALFARCFRRAQMKLQQSSSKSENVEPDPIRASDFLVVSRLLFDSLVVIILLASLTLFPFTVIGFICWIEWYIRNDGTPTEGPSQVGQWSVLVSVAVILLASSMYQLKDLVASKEELQVEIEKVERHLTKLRGYLAEKTE
jgi:hypothetical protein